MSTIKEILHEKRETTEKHIKQLQQDGKQDIRYTAMMPVVPFLILGLLSDVGWIIHLIAGTIYFYKNGLHHVLDYIAFIALVAVIFGVIYIIYLNKIHEKEIAKKHQKDFSFGMTVYSGLAGVMIGIFQMMLYAGVSTELVWVVIGGFLNFAFGLPIYLSFKKGIFYGVK